LTSAVRTREDYEREEFERLAPYAVKSAESLGRIADEAEHEYRTAFQRDRDRIVHSQAFRRLEYKTQVFVHHEGDHYRNRLTHTLEASQIARTIARALRVNEELAEAIALAHDLGHTPFGHAGERGLDRLLEKEGGFDHNRQSLRIVDLLEVRYPDFRGLNLTAETREGILKHGSDWEHPVPLPAPTPSPSIEAQTTDVSDEVAYTNHDLDDGLRSGLLTLEMLDEVRLWRRARASVEERVGEAPTRVLRAQTIVALMNHLVTDLIEASGRRLQLADLDSVAEVRDRSSHLVGFSEVVQADKADLKNFLYLNLYSHPRVLQVSERAQGILGGLFRTYREDPGKLPVHVVARFAEEGEARAVGDYIAGMTDRFALAEHRRLLDSDELL
jgi:dGTPase